MASSKAGGNKSKKGRRPKESIETAIPYALGHATRVEILIALNEGLFTAQELADRLGRTTSYVGNHLRWLLEDGSIEVGRKEVRGGTVQYWYKAVEIPVYTPEDAERMTPLHRKVTVGAITQAGFAEILAALSAGTLSEPDTIVYWDWYNLDAEGQRELDVESHRYLDRLREIEAASTNRRAVSGEESKSMLVKLDVFPRARKYKNHD
jgi:DNA-binding transcriptional ArsR family regulator